jgi:hypothetical protein
VTAEPASRVRLLIRPSARQAKVGTAPE